MRFTLASMLCGVLAAAATPATAAPDAAFSVVIDPTTGATSLRNDSGAPLTIDGYLFDATSDLFDRTSWSSLTDNSTPGWVEGGAVDQSDALSEVNLGGDLTLPAGGTIDLGSAYTPFAPAEFAEPEPTFDFSYSVPGSGVFAGDVEFSTSNNIVLVIDRSTGDVSLTNQSGFGVSIDSYLVLSGAGAGSVLDPIGWTPLEDSQGAPGGWKASPGSTTRIGEGNLLGSAFLAPNGGSLPLGQPINLGALEDELDVSLEFSLAGQESVSGNVLFVGEAATVVEGDFNADGRVDNGDLNLLLGSWGDSTVPASWVNSFIAPVDNGELNALLGDWGFGVPSVAIPEPTSLVLLGLAAAAVRRR